MGMTDPLGDMLTSIRNAVKARFVKVDIPASNLKTEIARVLKDEGYIKKFKVIKDDKQSVLRIYLKFDEAQSSAIAGIVRVSKPGRRVYVKSGEIKPVMNGLGISILTTSTGVMADREAKKVSQGGEVICRVW
jgi:small subunit ribosomal protein S8